MAIQFGVFDHIEPVPGLDLEQTYRDRLVQIERLDSAGFYSYHLAEHHTPAVHSLDSITHRDRHCHPVGPGLFHP